MHRRHWERLGLRPATVAGVIVCLLVLPSALSAQSANKLLENKHGQVSYEKAGTSSTLAPSASIELGDKDVAATGAASLGTITLPDSSLVSLGADTRVQLSFFSQTETANAEFVLYQGKTRFKIEHPNGAKANYTFVTPTSQIAVRGTEGDIGLDGDTLRVNVYHLTDPSLPVQVSFSNGKTVTLVGGQSLLAQVINGVIQTQIDKLTSALMGQFGEFGVPTTVDELKDNAVDQIRSRVRLPF
jgi:ferric-dicitrate binding protein FerR (iron transport regulator)